MITKTLFGKLDDAAQSVVYQYNLSNAAGMKISVLDYGATIRTIKVPQADGKAVNICLGYDTPAEYAQNSGYFGGTIGRYANRIADAAFELDGTRYTLGKNEGANSLHGGLVGFNSRFWHCTPKDAENKLDFTLFSPDGEEGFPGNVQAHFSVTLSADNHMLLEYRAETDHATPLNMTNHFYFNLNGQGNGNILGHTLRLFADAYTPVNSALIPTGEIADVSGTALDFRAEKTIRRDFPQSGYDHNFVFGKPGEAKLMAIVRGEQSGIRMTLHSNAAGCQCYTGNYITERQGTDGARYAANSGMCLETQCYPDSPNQANFPCCILRPGEKYYHFADFAFDCIE